MPDQPNLLTAHLIDSTEERWPNTCSANPATSQSVQQRSTTQSKKTVMAIMTVNLKKYKNRLLNNGMPSFYHHTTLLNVI